MVANPDATKMTREMLVRIAYAITGGFGLILNIMIIIVLHRSTSKQLKKAFYIFAYYLAITDTVILAAFFFVPSMYSYELFEKEQPILLRAQAYLVPVAYNTLVFEMLLVGMNRLLSVLVAVSERMSKTRMVNVLDKPNLVKYFVLAALLLSILCVALMKYGADCEYMFFPETATYNFNCTSFHLQQPNYLFRVYFLWHYSVPFLLFITYTSIYLVLHRQGRKLSSKRYDTRKGPGQSQLPMRVSGLQLFQHRTESARQTSFDDFCYRHLAMQHMGHKRSNSLPELADECDTGGSRTKMCEQVFRKKHLRRQEKAFLIQASIISGVYLIVNVAFFQLTYWDYWLGPVLNTICCMLNSCVNPIIYLIFNPVLRRETGLFK